VGFDVLTTCQPSTVWCSRERLPAAAAQPAKVRQSCSATDLFYFYFIFYEIQEQKFPVWYTGIYRPISSNNRIHKNKLKQQL
jgi:hypothetical protein